MPPLVHSSFKPISSHAPGGPDGGDLHVPSTTQLNALPNELAIVGATLATLPKVPAV